MKKLTSILATGGICLALTSGASAETYRIAHFQPDGESTVVAVRWFAEQIKKATDGRLSFDVFTGGVLFPAKAHMQAISDGIVQEGFHNTGYTPSELPLSNALSAYAFVEPDPTTISAAYADWVMHDPAGLNEFQGQNVVALGSFSTPTYPFICNTSEPITSLDQLKGLKVRFGGGVNGKLLQDLGGVAVNIPAGEIYQALQNGSIDCAGILAAWLNIDNSLDEVSKSTTVMNWAGAFTSPLQLYNRDFWSGLSAEDRALIFKLAARTQARLQIRFNTDNQKALEASAAKGHPVVEPDQTIKDAVAKWVDNGVGDMAGVARDTYGVQDPEALFASFQPYVEKWRGLIGAMEDKNNEDELTQVLIENMYNDLDPATFGVK